MANEDRRQAVSDLVHLHKPLSEAISAVRVYPWDCDEELVVLGPGELRHALERFLDGTLSANELEEWANAVEGRDDIEFAPEDVIDLVTEVANPLVFATIDAHSMKSLLERINAVDVDS